MYRNTKFTNITEIERVNLYNEIWAEPVQTVAKRYDMSDTALRKHCKRLDIPLPYRGYWAKLESGQKIERTRLPKVTKEVSKYVREYLIKYRDDLDDMSDEELLSCNEFNLLTDETVLYIKEQCDKIKVSGQLRNACKEILDHIEEMERRKKRERELRSAVIGTQYYYNIRNKYGDNKSVLLINVAKENINRAYRIIDALIKALPNFEANIQVGDNHRVWNEPIEDKASISILRSHFKISIYEKKNDLVMDVDGNMKYCDQKDNNLENQLGQIFLDIMIEGNKRWAKWLVERRREHREWEEQLRVWEEEKRQKNLKKLREDRLEEMESPYETLATIISGETSGNYTAEASNTPGTATRYRIGVTDTLDAVSTYVVSNIVRKNSPPTAPTIGCPMSGKSTYNTTPHFFITTGIEPDGQTQIVEVKLDLGEWFNSVDNPAMFSTSGYLGNNIKTVFQTSSLSLGSHTVTIRCLDSDLMASSMEVVKTFNVQSSPFETITANVTSVKATHIQVLRSAVNSIREFHCMNSVVWGEEIIPRRTTVEKWPIHIVELRDALEPVITKINNFDVASTFDIPQVDWLPIGTDRPKADVMNQLQNLLLVPGRRINKTRSDRGTT